MRAALDVLVNYVTDDKDPIFGDDPYSKLSIDAEHDQVWIGCYRASNEPRLTDEELETMEAAGWFLDEENGGWSHFA